MKFDKKIPWRWLIFVICILTFGFTGVRNANEEANRQYQNLNKSDWAATNVWINSAECARETGAWLAICSENKLLPVAQFALADDPGHTFLLGLIARFKDRSVSVLDVARLNIFINFAGFVAISVLLFAVQLRVASLVVLMLGSVPYFSMVGASPHPGLVGAATMAAILPMTILFGELRYLSRAGYILFLGLGAALLGLAAMLREPIGTMGFVISLGALVYVAMNRIGIINSPIRKLRLLTLLMLVFLSWQTPRWVLIARDVFYPIQPVSLTQTHGISHNLYIGLGAGGENKFGIRWDDSVGDAVVKSVDPSVQYVSPEYFSILWQQYIMRVAEDPFEVVRIYAVKLLKILGHRLPEWAPPLWLVNVSVFALLVAAYRRRGRQNAVGYGDASIVLVTAFAFIGLFIAQGVLAHPAKQYAHPIGGFVLLIVAIGFELLVQSNYKKPRTHE